MTQERKETDFRVPLAEAFQEGVKRNPLPLFFFVAVIVIVWLGWRILADTALERGELRARIANLTEDLVHCHQVCNARVNRSAVDKIASAQNNTKP